MCNYCIVSLYYSGLITTGNLINLIIYIDNILINMKYQQILANMQKSFFHGTQHQQIESVYCLVSKIAYIFASVSKFP